jgi:hypothetical protein
MRKISLLNISASLVLVGGSFIIGLSPASAEPASVFGPMLQDIQNHLPSGIVMRLPSSLEDESSIYPALRTREDGLSISLSSQPDCRSRACQRGYLGVFQRDSDNNHLNYLRSQRTGTDGIVSRTGINLAEGIRGIYVDVNTGGMARSSYGAVVWNQGGLTFVVSGVGTERNIKNIARSMATEDPIAP